MRYLIIVIFLSTISPSLESDLNDLFFSKLNDAQLLNYTEKSIDNLFNNFAQETLLNLTNNDTIKRKKRDTNYKDDEYDVLNDKIGIYSLYGIHPAGQICPFNQLLINFNTISFNNQVITICLTENRFVVGRLVDADLRNFYNSTIYWNGITEYRDYGFKHVDYLVKDKQIYFVIAKTGVGLTLLKLDPFTMNLIKLEQQTISSNPSTINIWQPKTWKANQKSSTHLKPGQTWNLAVANTYSESLDNQYNGEEVRKKREITSEIPSNETASNETASNETASNETASNETASNLTKKSITFDATITRSKSFKSTLSLFYFDTESNYFDEYDRIPTFLVKDICTFTINNYDYMAIVNHKAGIQHHQVDSEIFKLDLHDGKWKSIQKIRTYGAVACEFFKFKTQDHPSEDEYFLVLANNHDVDENGRIERKVNSVVYKFYYDQFIPFQCLHTIGASDVKFIKLNSPDNLELNSYFEPIKESEDYGSEQNVLAISTQNGVQLYQYNGWKFVLSSVQYLSQSMGPSGYVVYSNQQPQQANQLIDNYLRSSSKLFTFNLRSKLYLVVSNQLKLLDLNCFRMLFKHENQLGNWYQSNLNWCNKLINNLQQIPQLFAHLNNELSKTFSINQKQPIHLNKIVFNREANFNRISSPVILDKLNRKNYSDILIRPLIEFNKQLTRVSLEEKSISNLIFRSLKLKSKQPQLVTAPLDFDNLNIHCSNNQLSKCQFSSIQTSQLNQHNVSNIDSRLVRINRLDFLWNNKFNFDRVVLFNELKVFGKVNNFNLKNNLITKSGNHRFEAPVVFNFSPVVKNIKVIKYLNKRNFNSYNVLLNNVDQNVKVPIIFNKPSIIEGNLNVNGLFNKFAPMNDLINSIVTKYSNVTINSDKKFLSGIKIDKLTMTETSTFNGFNLVDTYDNLFWLNKDFTINAPINFTNIRVRGNLRVDGLINGVSLSAADFVIANQTNVLNGFNTFQTPITVNYLYLNKSLNNMPTIYNQVDLFMKNTPQRILSPKYFRSNVHLNGNANVEGTVDNVKLSVFAQELESKAKRNYYSGLVTIDGSASFLNNLIVQGLVNGIKLNQLLSNALRTDERVINGFKEVIFASVRTPELKTPVLNYLNLERDLLLRNKPQIVYGEKRFLNGIFAQNNFNVTRLNQYHIGKDDLHTDILLRDVSQHIIGHKIIKGDLHVDNLIVSNLNGLNLNKLFTLNKDELVYGPVQFNNNVKFDSDLTVINLDQLVTANNYSINELLHNSLRYRLPQIINSIKGFRRIYVPRQSNLQVNQINDIKVNDFYSSIVYRDIPNQIVTGNKIFNNEIIIDNILFKNRWDGINPNELKDGFVHQNKDRTIHGSLLIKGDANFGKSLTIRSDILNNVYLPKFFEIFVPVDRSSFIKGNIKFNEVEFRNDVQIAGRINNLDLNRDIVFKNNKQQIIYGRKSFNNIFIRNHLELRSGYINDLNLGKLFTYTLRRNSNQTVSIRAPIIVEGDLITKSINVNNRINNLDLSALKRNILVDYKVNRSTIITGRKHFDTLILDGPSQIVNNGDFSGINLRLLEKTYLSLNRPQIIHNPIKFNNVVDVERLKVKGNLDVNTINNINVNDLLTNSLKSTGEQIVNTAIIFKGNVKVDNNILISNDQINNIKLNRDLMLKNRPYNIFYNTKRFLNGAIIENLTAKSNTRSNLVCLNTGKSLDLIKFTNNAVFNDGKHYNLTNLKQFRRIVVDDIVIGRELNGISFNERNLFINSPTARHLIKGTTILRGPINADSSFSVRKQINGINLNEFANDVVLRTNKDKIITSEKLILGSIEINNLNILGNINGHNITDLAKQTLYRTVNSTSVKRALNEEDNILDRIDYCLRN